MKVLTTALQSVLIIEPKAFPDERGFFMESFNARRYEEAGVPGPFVQDNHSRSVRGTIRGLHYQFRHPQGKLVRVVQGAVFDVAVDIRRGSPTFGQWVGVELSAENKRQLYIPPDFAHGFCVTSEVGEVEYKCTAYYAPDDQHGVRWDDPTIAISWPIATAILSPKDQTYEALAPDRPDLPVYGPV